MSGKTYRDYALEIAPTVIAPGAESGAKLSEFLGLMIDLLAEWDAQAVKAPLLLSDTSPTDALPFKGAERMMPRYAADTDDTYRARLVDAWDRWAQAGTRQGIADEFAAAGVADVEFYTALAGDWDWDGDADNWSRFWCVLAGHSWTGPHLFGETDLVFDGSWTFGSSATPAEVSEARALVRRLKPAHMVCANIIVVLDDVQWAIDGTPDGTWDDVSVRPTSACYWNG